MIKNYKFKNFQSYQNECSVDLSVSKKSAHSYFDYVLEDGSKLTKVMAVFGANGAGKSNLLKPLAFLSWFLTESFRSGDVKDIPIMPFVLKDDEPTTIEIDFVVQKAKDETNEFEYRYSVELTRKMVLNESLKFKTSKLYSNVISRSYDHESKRYIISNSPRLGVSLSQNVLEESPSYCSIVSYLMAIISDSEDHIKHRKNSCLRLAATYFKMQKTNVGAVGRLDTLSSDTDATQMFIKNPELFEKVKSIICGYDLGVSDIVFEKKVFMDRDTGQDIEKTVPMFIHKTVNGEFKLPIWLESSGTKSAYCVLGIIAETLALGGVAVLDEFDNDFHPLLTVEVINLFKDDSINNRNAQLIFNTHTTEILKHLKMQHCYLVEKVNGISEAYRADQVDGLLARDNLYSKYISGALGAVPEFG